MSNTANKVAQFQHITGLQDTNLCTQILSAHNWDLQRAISSITSPSPITFQHSGLPWQQQLITLPFSIISTSLGLVSGVVALVASVYSYALNMIGLSSSGSSSVRLVTPEYEAMDFVSRFTCEFGDRRPNFVTEGFMDALQRSRCEFKLLFVYLHSPDQLEAKSFCESTLCNEVLLEFVNENFVAWGGSIRGNEGFRMSNSLKAFRFPFCAVAMGGTSNTIALLQQVEGPKSPEEMLTVLQSVLEENGPVLVSARLDAEERRNNIRLREEQDAAYQAALEADQAREREKKEEEERVEREAAKALKIRMEEEEAHERATIEAAEREAKLIKLREGKLASLGLEPEKGPDVTQVLVRLPNGERKGRRFHCTATIQSVYDFVDSSGTLEIGNYTLVTNFPRVVYDRDKLSLLSLEQVGLHPQASLFVEMK
ncbi:plant UBX domain-containing protein 10-like [Bidens hawaiensis]|uniref:plant UBX domain-containing protein 10-like n=1 Tax=Bidens hawaiensis TaxID=980011 RepID=UPI004049A8A5